MIVRMMQTGVTPQLRLDLRTAYQESDLNSYNVIADIPGEDPALRDQVVIVGAHLDSLPAATGATDNADGAAAAVEAMRILKAVGAHPRRTIRVAIWSGEEVGFVGGRAYVQQHLADAASRDKVAVYLNNDPGTGATYGWYMPPKKPVAWTGTREALDFGPSCPQLPGFKTPEIQLMQNLASGPSSEDCLVLNVWTPATDGAKRPVMFWLHGGGFQFGSGSQPFYDGENLARRGNVVTITINHRLGCLGYLHLADLGGPAFAKSGNVGILDAVAALEWVRDNIERFGGDPKNVMLIWFAVMISGVCLRC